MPTVMEKIRATTRVYSIVGRALNASDVFPRCATLLPWTSLNVQLEPSNLAVATKRRGVRKGR